ncbi:unnamed protein product [Owenia fusiformis]|uniref:Uncharacterized protein n=1 Tax=Owenia fusiformis TaxID=6347 RepID=A0A8J1TUN1_OWEFU|nr:unnamed protein product [Owenia fusiformis]
MSKLNCYTVLFLVVVVLYRAHDGNVNAETYGDAGLTSSHARWCTISNAEEQKCVAMKNAFSAKGWSPNLQCVLADDKYDCMRRIEANEADLMTLGDTQVYSAGRYFNMVPVMAEKYSESVDAGTFRYKAVIAVKTSDTTINTLADLKGKKSCHTGVGRTVGWAIPVAALFEQKLMEIKDCDNNVKSVANFFSQSCAPGAFDDFYNPDKDNPQKICGGCSQTGCPLDPSETYMGYVGAFACLKDGKGDVAFIKHSTVEDAKADARFTNLNEQDYQLLCPDGTRKSMSEWDSCNWAVRTSNTIMTRPDAAIADFKHLLQKASAAFANNPQEPFNLFNSSAYGGQNLLFSDDTKSLTDVGSANSYDKYLGSGANRTMEWYRPCRKPTTWCVTSTPEMNKCRRMGAALASSKIDMQFSCILGTNSKQCMEMIQQKKADLVNVDGGDVFTGGKYHDLKPIVAENYGSGADEATSYYAVAVVKKSSTITNLAGLRGKKSCHTGIGKTSGWNVPVGTLIEKNLISVKGCDIPHAVGDFFAQSCAPGALDAAYNPSGTNPANLCAQCGPNNCKRNNVNKYYGYTGALRCLVETDADVAFIKHSTVPSNTDGKNMDDWAKTLKSSDFELLCRDGGRKAITEWRTCSLARVPSHAILTSKTRPAEDSRHWWILLNRGQIRFGTDNTNFKMFDSGSAGSNLMFSDSTTTLTKVDSTYQDFLGAEYAKIADTLDHFKCSVSGAPSTASSLVSLCVISIMAYIGFQIQ